MQQSRLKGMKVRLKKFNFFRRCSQYARDVSLALYRRHGNFYVHKVIRTNI